jgi:hypothetical protein
MIRVLIIGREAATWGERLQRRVGDELELDTARLPAAGLRQFEATPPDALVVIDSASTKRAATLVAAVRERPIGQLIPMLVIAPPPTEEDQAEVDAWLSPNSDVARLAAALEECLGVELSSAPAPKAPTRPESGGSSMFPAPDQPQSSHSAPNQLEPNQPKPDPPAYFIEEIDDGPNRPQDQPQNQPRRLGRDSIFSRSSPRAHERQDDQARVDEEAVKRKLRAVRHEDYYAILEVRRGAEGAVVREAFHRLYRRFDSREIDFEVAHRMEEELGELRDALEDAWAVLGDPKLREAYLEHTTRR